jgi:tryptophan-rich sensory protein
MGRPAPAVSERARWPRTRARTTGVGDETGTEVGVSGMRRRSMLQAGACTGVAAVAGNAFVGKAAMDWFRGLAAPRWQLPLPAFLVSGALYYGIVGYVLARSIDRRDAGSTAWGLAVLVGNEAWNGVFFGRRSVRAGFVGLCAFVVPLVALQRSIAGDAHARFALAPYTAYVLIYDLPWTYRLWRLNPTSERTHSTAPATDEPTPVVNDG